MNACDVNTSVVGPGAAGRQKRWTLRAQVVVSAALLSLSQACSSTPAPARELPLEPCRLKGLRAQAQCGQLSVYENRHSKQGRELQIHLAVVPALASQPKPDPLFILVGGPGQSALKSGAAMAQALNEVHRHRDIVLVDQRGTGLSNPLHCESGGTSLADAFATDFKIEDMAKCLAQLDAAPEHYATPDAMDDLDDVRRALGYQQINLWGGSYGTRAALVYMRRHRAHVRRVILDGAVPTDIKLPLHAGRDAQRALDLVTESCRSQDACKALVPNVGASVQRILATLKAVPESITLAHPLTGEAETLLMKPAAFAAGLRMLLYVPRLTALIPFALTQIEQHNWSPFVAAVATLTGNIESDLQFGMFLSVVCSEDIPRISDEERNALTQGNFLGDHSLLSLQKACQRWPKAPLPESYFEPVTEAAPTLVLSGRLDPVTPPSWGTLVAERLPNAVHVIVEGVAHGVSAHRCLPHTIAEFLDSEAPHRTQAKCASALSSPSFFTDYSGARK